MNSVLHLQSLIKFHLWRRDSITQLIADIDSTYLTRELTGSFSSLYIVLNHLVWAEKVWLSRVKKNTTAMMPENGMNVDRLLQEWKQVSDDWAALIENTPENEFETVLTYFNSRGEKYSNTLGEIIIHFIDHSTYHIGQMMNAIRGFGLEPVQTNFIHYLRALKVKEI